MSLCLACASAKFNAAHFRELSDNVRDLRAEEENAYRIAVPETNLAIGSLTHVQENKSSCPFCRLVASSLEREFPNVQFGPIALQSPITGYHRFSDASVTGFDIKLSIPNETLPSDSELKLEGLGQALGPQDFFDVCGFELSPLRNLQLTFTSVPWLDSAGLDPSHDEKMRQVDLGSLRSCWLNCSTYHSRCRPLIWSRQSLPIVLRVIDVEQNRVVQAPEGCQYVALSYRWAQSTVSMVDHDAHQGAASKLKLEPSAAVDFEVDMRNVPRTIRDAMDVVKDLGGRYLWVDALCVPQSDALAKARLFENMDLVYQYSVLTIVAAGAHDASGPIPGLGPDIRRARPRAEVIDGCTIGLPHPTLEGALEQSPWAHRAWTYQENYTSIRKLFFTQDRVFYKCLEGIDSEPFSIASVESNRQPIPNLCHIWETTPQPVIQALDRDYSQMTMAPDSGIESSHVSDSSQLFAPIPPMFKLTRVAS